MAQGSEGATVPQKSAGKRDLRILIQGCGGWVCGDSKGTGACTAM